MTNPSFEITKQDGTEFIANGVKYIVREDLSMKRFNQLQLFKIWMQLPVDEGTLLGLIIKVYKQIPLIMRDPAEGQDLQIELYQYMEGLKRVQEEGDIAFWICTLFFNAEEEEWSEWTVELGKKKISEWEKSGAPATFFLGVSLPLISNSMKTYEKFMENTLKKKRQEIEELENNGG